MSLTRQTLDHIWSELNQATEHRSPTAMVRSINRDHVFAELWARHHRRGSDPVTPHPRRARNVLTAGVWAACHTGVALARRAFGVALSSHCGLPRGASGLVHSSDLNPACLRCILHEALGRDEWFAFHAQVVEQHANLSKMWGQAPFQWWGPDPRATRCECPSSNLEPDQTPS